MVELFRTDVSRVRSSKSAFIPIPTPTRGRLRSPSRLERPQIISGIFPDQLAHEAHPLRNLEPIQALRLDLQNPNTHKSQIKQKSKRREARTDVGARTSQSEAPSSAFTAS